MQGLEGWIGVVGGLLTAALGIFRYFNYRTRLDRAALVGQAFASTIDGLSAEAEPKQLASAILLRRFFDRHSEQGQSGTPYGGEAIGIIAALLRGTRSGQLQKLLADGLAYAPSLRGADLQHCNLNQAYFGTRLRTQVPNAVARLMQASRMLPPRQSSNESASPVDLSHADLFGADLTGASLRGAIAQQTVFYTAVATGTVFKDAHLEGADFREAKLKDANFGGAWLERARFAGAADIPPGVGRLLDATQTVPAGAGMPLVVDA